MLDINVAQCFKALGDETRAKIVDMLKGGSLCACMILEKFNITQPTLSYHMKSLTECGLVRVQKVSTWNHYTLNLNAIHKIKDFFGGNICGILTNECGSNSGLSD